MDSVSRPARRPFPVSTKPILKKLKSGARTTSATAPLDHLHYEVRETGYRCVLADSSDLYLQERYHEALARPLESIDDLKKLVFIAAKMKELNIEFAPGARARQERGEQTRRTADVVLSALPKLTGAES